ncbi:MAG: sugar phosphate isomerase/epimerase [Clostridia bacterium]|nr:sugar phosphate isomerase/epimerase [Clostridia bacterium]
MFKIGLSTPGYVDEELFKLCKKAGIFYLEISPNSDKYKDLDFQKLKEWSEKYGVNIWSFHLPFIPFEKIDISKPSLAKQSVEHLCGFIQKGAEIGIDKFVIHASGEPIDDSEREKRVECSKNSLATLAEFAGKYNAIIAIEDLPRSCLGKNSDEIKELLSAHSSLKVCFDTNHLLTGETHEHFINELAGEIITTHISDYDYVNERHWLPGEGKIHWQSLIKALKAINYDGVWLYEIDFGCPRTIIRPRDLVCEDFVLNAKELFEGKAPTVFSTPKENLGYWD